MTREEKNQVVEDLKVKFSDANYFYITDSSELTVEQVNNLRSLLFEKGIRLQVVKNTLAKKAMESLSDTKDFSGLYECLKGPTSFIFTEVGNVPAKVIKQFRESHDKPLLKGAYIDSSVYIGDDQLSSLASLKSKEELIAEIISLLQSPAKNVVGALQSGGSTIAGLVKALQDRAEAAESA